MAAEKLDKPYTYCGGFVGLSKEALVIAEISGDDSISSPKNDGSRRPVLIYNCLKTEDGFWLSVTQGYMNK